MLEQRLREIILNPIDKFMELEKEEYYYFAKWCTDKKYRMCLYYWFWNTNKIKKNTGKKVVISEVEYLIRNCLKQRKITRDDFKEYCPVTNNGPCGFAVTGRMLEHLGIAQYLGWGRGFEIIDVDLAQSLVE